MKYIDIHCHLDFPDYGNDLKNVILRMKENEVGAITIGTDLVSSKRVIEIAENVCFDGEAERVWACIGVHPRGGGEFNFLEFEKLISHPKVIAIGECGLDWFRIKPENFENEKERQTTLFKQQIELALKFNKPLMLHCRESYDDVLDILAEYKKEAGEKLRGNTHFFAGSIEQAKKFLDLGFTLSFTGVITFTHDYDEVINFLPTNSIMSETDSPFVAPVPRRGEKNEPSFVKYVVERMASIKEESIETFSQKLLLNAQKMFRLNF